jgi:hypothetical protein
MELPIVLLIIVASLLCVLLSIACCVVRCFRPQNAAGSVWFDNTEGKRRLVKGAFESGDGLTKPSA